MENLTERLSNISDQIRNAELKCNRITGSVQLLAVSKQQSTAAIEALYASGQRCFGENYPQEAAKKMAALQHLQIEWHFIGHIQSNKTHILAEKFDWVHSIDRIKVANRLNDQRPKNFKPLNVCLQVNLDRETSKGGIDPSSALKLAIAVNELSNLRLRGLMAIPQIRKDAAAQLLSFRQLAKLHSELNAQGLNLDTLSMGMTGDFEAAIATGATIVRIGTGIFGSRNK